MNYSELIAKITADIVPGLPKGITAEKLRALFNDLAQFANETRGDYQGTAAPASNPGTPTTPVFYIATTSGTYTNFGGLVVTAADGLNLLSFVPGSGWTKAVVPIELAGYASIEQFEKINQGLNEITIMPFQFDLNTLINNVRILRSNGAEFATNEWKSTGFLPVNNEQILRYIGFSNATTSVSFYNENQQFISSPTPTGSDSYLNYIFVVPENAKFIRACGNVVLGSQFTLEQVNFIFKDETVLEKANQFSLDQKSKIIFVSDSLGNNTFEGTFEKPVKTISKGIELAKTGGFVCVRTGDYYETIDFLQIQRGKITLFNYHFDKVRIMGSEKIQNITKTSGKTNIYQAPFLGTIQLTGGAHANGFRIFEDGIASKLIPVDEIHPLQKSQTHRLPFSEIKQITDQGSLSANLTFLDSLTGENSGYWVDSGIIYVVNSRKVAPTDLHFPVRNNTNSIVTNSTIKPTIAIELRGLQFFYSLNKGLDLYGFSKIEIFDISAFGSRLNGIDAQSSHIEGKCVEAGGCGLDGIASQLFFSTPNLSRELQKFEKWNSIWCHDCYDDGFSIHQNGACEIDNFLFEYCNDTGLQNVNCSYTTLKNGEARKNGKGIVINGGAINVNTRNSTSLVAYNVISRDNKWNFESGSDANTRIAIMHLVNCFSKNAENFGFRASGTSQIKTINCQTKNDVVIKTGNVIIDNYEFVT